MPSSPILCTVAAIIGFSALALGETAIEGRVALPKSRGPVVMNKRYTVVSRAGEIGTDPALAVIYLEGKFPKPSAQPIARMAQKDLTFLTPLLAVQVGTKVEFPNEDDCFHNIFSYSPAKRFDLGRYRPEERPIPSQVFDAAGPVMLRCDIHEHMRALILVLDTPHFVVSRGDGSYRLTGVPAGRYKLKAWISSRRILERDVEVKSGSTLRVDFD